MTEEVASQHANPFSRRVETPTSAQMPSHI
jgi:hypothetical protein